jgi:general stress protein 26
MKVDELKKAAIELMEVADGAYVTTVGADGYPRTRVMFNLRNKTEFPTLAHLFVGHERDLMIYLGTNTSSAKTNEIRENPKGCVYFADCPHFVGMMFAGDLEIVEDPKVRRALWVEGWERYYPAGPDDPDYTVLRLFPKFVCGWYRSSRIDFQVERR